MSQPENNKETNKKQLLYFQVTDIWKRLCEEHTDLLDKTFEEYATLLSSDMDKLEIVLDEKEKMIERINALEVLRTEVLSDVKAEYKLEIDNVSDLLKVMRDFEEVENQKHLTRFNLLLIDLIEKIQEQNKKNQLFINKAILSLEQIREETLGLKNYSTYGQKGTQLKRPTMP